MVHYIHRMCDMYSYSDEYETVKGVPDAHEDTGYTKKTWDNFILILNKALWMPNLRHSVINPNQLCHNDVDVQDNPYTKDPMVIQRHEDNFTAYIEYTGTNTHLTTWNPTTDDMNKFPHVVLSSSNPWDTHTIQFQYIYNILKKGILNQYVTVRVEYQLSR